MVLLGRSQTVRDLLKVRMHPLTAQEICSDLGYPMGDAKFVSSICEGEIKKGSVEAVPDRICSVTRRRVKAYMWATVAHTQAQAPRPSRPRRPKVKPAQAPTPPPPKLTPEQRARVAARMASAEAARQARDRQRVAHMAADEKVRAYLAFERHTGCRSRDFATMKSAYRQRALKIHPDHGGDWEAMAELNGAWAIIEQAK